MQAEKQLLQQQLQEVRPYGSFTYSCMQMLSSGFSSHAAPQQRISKLEPGQHARYATQPHRIACFLHFMRTLN
jgi:hypothetical protein